MGLDMYLKGNRHLGKAKVEVKLLENEYDWYKNTEVGKTYIIEDCTDIQTEVGYWRKANAIHKWFVNNIQDGEDNCGEYYVSREELKKLLDLCKEVRRIAIIKKQKVVERVFNDKTKEFEDGIVEREIIQNGEEIEKLLPTCDGFFFGSVDYDYWYLENIDYTIELIERILKDKKYKDYDFYYHSSW